VGHNINLVSNYAEYLASGLHIVAKTASEFEIYNPEIILISVGDENSYTEFTQPIIYFGESAFTHKLLNTSFGKLVSQVWRQNLQLMLLSGPFKRHHVIQALESSLWWTKCTTKPTAEHKIVCYGRHVYIISFPSNINYKGPFNVGFIPVNTLNEISEGIYQLEVRINWTEGKAVLNLSQPLSIVLLNKLHRDAYLSTYISVWFCGSTAGTLDDPPRSYL